MKQINFIEVGMENYGPYIEPMVLNFGSDQVVMIVGPNGIGKTMALDAICFAFYGMTSKGLRADDVVNNITEKNCKVWVKFNVDDVRYKITRYQKYHKVGSTVILRRNGVDIKKGHKEVVPEIDRLICTRKSYLNTLMFGQKVKDFFTDITDSDKKEIFRSILTLDKYKIYYDKCSAIIKEIQDAVSEIQRDIVRAEGQLETSRDVLRRTEEERRLFIQKQKEDILTYQTRISECKRMYKKWEAELEQMKEPDLQKIESEISEYRNQLSNYHNTLDSETERLKNQRENKINELYRMASEKLAELGQKLSEIRNKSNEKIISLKDFINDYTEKNTEKRNKYAMHNNSLEEKITQLGIRIGEIESRVLESQDAKCPMCEQPITESKKAELEKLVGQYHNDCTEIEKIQEANETERKKLLEELKLKADEINDEIAEIKSKVKLAEAQNTIKETETDKRLKDALSKVLERFKQEQSKIMDKYLKDTQNITKKLEEAEKRKQEEARKLEKYREIQNSMKQLESDLSYNEKVLKSREEQEYDESQAKEYKKKVHILVLKIEELKKDIEDENRRLSIYEFWKGAFSSTGIPSILIDEAIPFMNKRVDYYLNMLTNGRYMVSFDTMDQTKSGSFRDKISVKVFDAVTRANNRLQFSGGQTRIIDIATILTLGDLQSNIQNVKFNLLVFDEIFDSLDDENINYVSRIMTKLKVGKSIYIISHRHVDQLDADEVLEFK